MKWKQKHNFPKYMGWSRSSSKRESIPIQAYLKKQEKSQMNNLTLYRKELEREQCSIEGKNNKDKSKNKWTRRKKRWN